MKISKRPRLDLHIDEHLRHAPKIRATNSRMTASLVKSFQEAQPVPCEWLSRETHVLPRTVNIVYTVNLRPADENWTINMVRMAQSLPPTKYMAAKFAGITIRLLPTTGRLFKGGNMVLVKSTSHNMARYHAQLYRQLLETVPMLMRDPETGEIRIDTLSGRLVFENGTMQNVVGSAALPQQGVHLGDLLYHDQSKCYWMPGSFPSLILSEKLEDGTPYFANIASTGKVVLMGLKNVNRMYDAYRATVALLQDFEDPNVPVDPSKRLAYRVKQLQREGRIREESAKDKEEFANIQAVDEEGLEEVIQQAKKRSKTRITLHDELTLLMEACDHKMEDNVAYMLQDPAMANVWARDPQGLTALERIQDSTEVAHVRISRMLREHMKKHPKK
jgi:TATA-box binding protein (TBP) (component of TFIID and TFIIIB)